ncbi:MAG TPA: right-handed parallel beta-helix repeat-containing protein [Candidatus Angelobacter sp.]|jgi:hypothetical protein|nr:right-handed parallel beta-helix repeat-containing protein [Candidatus Angelobacter sp.]
MRRFILYLLLLILLPLTVANAQYYVCNTTCVNGATGNDSNAGTFAAPFLTLLHAQAAMSGGSTKKTIIEAGTFTLGANWAFTSADAGETWVSYPGATVVISGGASPATTNKTISIASGATGMVFKGLTFQNLGTVSGNNGGFVVTGNGTIYNDVFQYNSFTNCEDYCIAFNHMGGVLVDSNTFNNVLSALPGSTGSAVIAFTGANNMTFSHNTCSNTAYACLDTDNGVGAPATSNVIYDANIVINACNAGTPDCGALYMMDRTITSTGYIMRNNVINGVGDGSHTDETKCLYLDDDVSNVTVTGNLCFNDPGAYGMMYHGTTNAHVTNNVFVLAPGGLAGFYQIQTAYGATGTTMSGNTFQNNVVRYTGTPTNPMWRLSGSPTNFPAVSGNLFYSATGTTIQNSQTNFIDSSPIFCGPSMGPSPAALAAATALWGSIANGVVGNWAQLAVNQGTTFRNCSAGF